jgi:peptidoglycan/LPS O-acetylase OafA/YrhL
MGDDAIVTDDKKKTKVFFSNLNGVRAIAAFMVVVAHIEFHKASYNIPMITGINLFNLGKVGVTIFFSLSGFLITYLLLEERKNYVKVNLRAFYVRRILRIWPLYFLIILFGFFVYPQHASPKALWLSLFFLPNLAFVLNLLPDIFDTIWSIGTEEQFYIFHPHFFRIKKIEHVLYALVLFIVVFFLLDGVVKIYGSHSHRGEVLAQLFYYARYDNMMIGAIVAVLYFNTKNTAFNFKFQKAFNLLFNKNVQLILLMLFIVFVLVYITWLPPQGDVVISILSALLIVNLCEPATSIYSLNNGGYQFVGNISYGIYLLHKFPLFLVLYLVNKYLGETSILLRNIVVYAATFTATIGIASASYYGYEKYFLTLKKRFQRITQ